jgi:flagellar FliL protein
MAAPVLGQEEPVELPPGSTYVSLGPSFIGNFGTEGRLRYFKVDMSVRVLETGAAEVEQHLPRLRHVLLMLLSRQPAQAVSRPEDREQIREQALNSVRAIIDEEEGDNEVEDLLFTSFIIQG